MNLEVWARKILLSDDDAVDVEILLECLHAIEPARLLFESNAEDLEEERHNVLKKAARNFPIGSKYGLPPLRASDYKILHNHASHVSRIGPD